MCNERNPFYKSYNVNTALETFTGHTLDTLPKVYLDANIPTSSQGTAHYSDIFVPTSHMLLKVCIEDRVSEKFRLERAPS